MIDERYVDIGEKDIPDGYLASCLPRYDTCGSSLPVFEDSFPQHPRSEWDALISAQEPMEMLIRKTKDQGQEGSCCPNAFCQGFEVCWNLTFGTKCWLEFSPISLYRWLSGSPKQGVYIPDAFKQARDVGLLPCDTPAARAFLEEAGLNPEHVLQPTGYYQKFPSGWQETAAHFQLPEGWDIRTFDGIVSANLDQFPVVYGRAGHAILNVAVKKPSSYYLRYWNSWNGWGETGENGLRGVGHDSESYVRGAVPSYGAIALRAVKVTDAIRKAVEKFRWE